MNIRLLATAAALAALFTGCAGTSPTRLVGNTIGVTGGALLGSTFDKRNALAAAAGAGVGLLLSESLMPGAPMPPISPTLPDMKKDEAIPPSSNTTGSSSDNGSQPEAPTS